MNMKHLNYAAALLAAALIAGCGDSEAPGSTASAVAAVADGDPGKPAFQLQQEREAAVQAALERHDLAQAKSLANTAALRQLVNAEIRSQAAVEHSIQSK